MPVFLQDVAPVYMRAGAGHISLRDIPAIPALELEIKENGAMVRSHIAARDEAKALVLKINELRIRVELHSSMARLPE
jgi:hypothetical protein